MKDLNAQYNDARQGFGVIGEQIAQATNDYNAALNQVNNLNIAIQTNQYGGLDVANAAVQRDAAMQNLDAIRNRKLALEAQRDQLTLAVAGMYGQADKLKVALAQADGVRFSGVQRMMELAEDQDPPPPAPVPTPPPAAAPPILQGPPPTAVVPTETPQDQVYDNYSIISTPIGLPFFPGFPRGLRINRHPIAMTMIATTIAAITPATTGRPTAPHPPWPPRAQLRRTPRHLTVPIETGHALRRFAGTPITTHFAATRPAHQAVQCGC